MQLFTELKKMTSITTFLLAGFLIAEPLLGASGGGTSLTLPGEAERGISSSKKDIKCSVFNGMSLVVPEMSRINVALDMGSGKLSFQVRDRETGYFMSYDPPKEGQTEQDIDHQIKSYIAALRSVNETQLTEKDSGLSYKLDRIAPTPENKQEFMNRLMSALEGAAGENFPFVIATGAWRIAKINSQALSTRYKSRVNVLSADQEVALTAISLELNPEKTDLTLTGAAGVAAGTPPLKELVKTFKNTKDIQRLAEGVIASDGDNIADATLFGVLWENIHRSVQFSANNDHHHHRRAFNVGDEHALCLEPFSCAVHLHS